MLANLESFSSSLAHSIVARSLTEATMDHRTNADGAAAEPLLPVRTPGGHATAAAQDASPPRLREKYLKQLGYTPLIFRVRRLLWSHVAVVYYQGTHTS